MKVASHAIMKTVLPVEVLQSSWSSASCVERIRFIIEGASAAVYQSRLFFGALSCVVCARTYVEYSVELFRNISFLRSLHKTTNKSLFKGNYIPKIIVFNKYYYTNSVLRLCHGGRVVKALDSKSNGIFPHRFESCP